jgi:MscS family membrane protein
VRHAIRPVILALGLLAALASAASPQGLLPTGLPTTAAPPAGSASVAADPYGRETPAGTVMGFLAAGSSGDWARAAKYLDTRLTEQNAEELARELKVLLDRGLTTDLSRLSRNPAGEQDQRVGQDHELVGSIETESGRLEVLLLRVHHADEPPYWLFAPETLRDVPAAYSEYAPSFIEGWLPKSFVQGYGERYRLWSWIVMAAAGLVALIVSTLLWRLLTLVVRLAARRVPAAPAPPQLRALLRPLYWVILGATLEVLSAYLLTLRQRYIGGRLATLLVIAAVTWLGVSAVATTIGRSVRSLEHRGASERVALVRLGGRLLQAVAVALGGLILLDAIGINLTPILAGLGVGGIAVALASQKTLENLFGGMMVIGDSPIRIGNFCRVGTMVGTVEDIGLRSTRIRTLARTIISIPNADLASQSIENFAARDKLFFNPVIGLRYETTADQLRHVLAEIRALLYRHEQIESSSARVRLLRFGASSLDVEVFAYVTVTDYNEFLAVQEDLLLRLMDTIEKSGTGLAFPSQTLYFTRDAGIDRDKAAQAVETVRGWREHGELPFPDITPEQKAKLEGTVEFPPIESVIRREKKRT